MEVQKLPTAIYVGVWPLTEAHDPALDEAGIPKGAAVFVNILRPLLQEFSK